MNFKKEDSFIHLCNRNKLEKYIKRLIKNYTEEEGKYESN